MPAPADCTDAAALEAMRVDVEQQLGPVDVLAAFAGGGRQPQPVFDITEEDWKADVDPQPDLHVPDRHGLPPRHDRAQPRVDHHHGVAGARKPGEAPIAYAAAKAGIIVFSQQVANEVGPAGVRVNCLSPSTVLNEHWNGPSRCR
jgi:3-oxoacyl-[acyl-carrier protein] reductase